MSTQRRHEPRMFARSSGSGWGGHGGLRGLGIALLHARRARHSIVFERHSGERVEFPVDAFPELDRLVRAVARAGVPLDGPLSSMAGKVPRRSRHSPRPSRSLAP